MSHDAHTHDEEPLASHPHTHEHEGRHRHPHHHRRERTGHAHPHPVSFDRLTYVCSPVHDMDPRAKVAMVLVLVLGVVSTPPMRAGEFAAVTAMLLAVLLLARLPLRPVLLRSALVIPLAGGIALFAPLGSFEGPWSLSGVAQAYIAGWPVMWGVLSKAWLSALSALLLAATTPAPRLFAGLRALGMPTIFITMLTFLYRYTDVLGDQLRSLRRAVASRGPALRGRRLVALYGNLAGNLFIRAYERGERVHAAMLSRGFDGTLPATEPLRMTAPDLLAIATALLAVAAIALY